jgi:hypothetical protein
MGQDADSKRKNATKIAVIYAPTLPARRNTRAFAHSFSG